MDKETENKVKALKDELYENYKSDWINFQKHIDLSFPDTMKKVEEEYKDYIKECIEEYGESPDEVDSFDDYLMENGYHGTCYACKGEFFDCEMNDIRYVVGNVDKNTALFLHKYDFVLEECCVDEINEAYGNYEKSMREQKER